MKKNMPTKILLVGIFLVAFFLRFYQLGNIPAGFLNDEADIGYDSYSILATGHDQWNTFLPVANFKGFGDDRPVVYSYLVVPAIRIFGLTPFAVRFPSALFGTLSVLILFLFASRLLSLRAGFISALLLAISPWAIGMSRIGIESNVAITFVLLALYSASWVKKYPVMLLVSALFFVLTIYTYAAYTLFVPLCIILGITFYWKELFKQKQYFVLSLIIFGLLLLPLFFRHNAAGTRFGQVGFAHNITSIGISANLNDEIGACRSRVPSIICKLGINKAETFVTVLAANYLHHFSFDFLYLHGTSTQYSVLPERGLEYMWEVLFLICGVAYAVVTKKKSILFIFLLLLLAAIPDTLTSDGHYSRATLIQPFLLIVEGVGGIYIWELLSGKRKIGWLGKMGISVVVVYSVFSFWILYTSYFKIHYALNSQFGYADLMHQVQQQQKNYKEIYISRHLHDTKQYAYYLFYTSYDPQIYQTKKRVAYTTQPDGWIDISQIDTIHFANTLPDSREVKGNTLLISDPIDFPKDIPAVFLVKDLENNVLFKGVRAADMKQYLLEQSALQKT